MSDTPELPAAGLRLAGHIGQATLDWVAAAGAAALADLDQHVAAVREALADSMDAIGRGAAAIAARGAVDARAGGSGYSGLGDLLSAMTSGCPDVPFAADAPRAPSAPLPLLLHYICGFLEETATRNWRPGFDWRSAPDWESMRLAAACRLIRAAQATATPQPDLDPRG